jgi:hypothetical protein
MGSPLLKKSHFRGSCLGKKKHYSAINTLSIQILTQNFEKQWKFFLIPQTEKEREKKAQEVKNKIFYVLKYVRNLETNSLFFVFFFSCEPNIGGG